MKLYPENFETKIGFDKIRAILKEHCLGELGRSFVDKIRPDSRFDRIIFKIQQTDEFKRILLSGDLFPNSQYLDVSAHLTRARVPGSYIDEEGFGDIKRSLTTLFNCLEYFEENKEEYPNLYGTCRKVELNERLLREIESVFDPRGKVKDNASDRLGEIRNEIQNGQQKARSLLNRILKDSLNKGYCPEDSSLTVRDGRMVIPILAEHKRQVKGFIHDESATGQTSFIEPAAVLDINNRIRELEYEEKREVIRILTELTDYLRPFLPDLEKAYIFLSIIDFSRAKARFAIDIDASMPKMVKQSILEWKKARHPILEIKLSKEGKKIVPLDITINPEQRVLLISGPNAGGKSVCLKTVGLVQYMFQCGLLPSTAEESTFGVFNQIFIDIGDEQSIENDLSTYSSHLRNMNHFLQFSDKKTVVLVDEFGTGTDPQFGGAIAQSILIELVKKRTFGVLTTHYANLKKMAEKTNGIENGAMRYDLDLLEPKYILDIGKPGSSFALEIAGKIGLPDHVIKSAKKLTGYSQVRFEGLINELEQEKERLRKANVEIGDKKNRLEANMNDYYELKNFLDQEKKRLIKEAKLEARQIVDNANKRIENTIREIREAEANKEKTREKREELKNYADAELIVEQKLSKSKTQKEPNAKTKIQVGDFVKWADGHSTAEVMSINGSKAVIATETIKTTTSLNDLEKVGQVAKRRSSPSIANYDITKKQSEFSTNLDLRGRRAEEAMVEAEKFLDEAVLLGHQQVKILHGKGYGVLRDSIRSYLRGNPYISAMYDEHVEMGGSGITVIDLKN